jgi:hypothetical protein
VAYTVDAFVTLREAGLTLSYGMAKAAVHHLVGSAAAVGAGDVIGLVPEVCASGYKRISHERIDTLSNRAGMPNADFSNWTKPEIVREGGGSISNRFSWLKR